MEHIQSIEEYIIFLNKNPTDVEFERFLYTGNNYSFLTLEDIPTKFIYIYNDVSRIKKYNDSFKINN